MSIYFPKQCQTVKCKIQFLIVIFATPWFITPNLNWKKKIFWKYSKNPHNDTEKHGAHHNDSDHDFFFWENWKVKWLAVKSKLKPKSKLWKKKLNKFNLLTKEIFSSMFSPQTTTNSCRFLFYNFRLIQNQNQK